MYPSAARIKTLAPLAVATQKVVFCITSQWADTMRVYNESGFLLLHYVCRPPVGLPRSHARLRQIPKNEYEASFIHSYELRKSALCLLIYYTQLRLLDQCLLAVCELTSARTYSSKKRLFSHCGKGVQDKLLNSPLFVEWTNQTLKQKAS